MSIDVKQAVERAKTAADQFFDDLDLVDLTLEEVEMTEDENHWLITLGFYVPNRNQGQDNLAFAIGRDNKYLRKYKTFKIDASTGRVLSMKIRQV